MNEACKESLVYNIITISNCFRFYANEDTHLMLDRMIQIYTLHSDERLLFALDITEWSHYGLRFVKVFCDIANEAVTAFSAVMVRSILSWPALAATSRCITVLELFIRISGCS